MISHFALKANVWALQNRSCRRYSRTPYDLAGTLDPNLPIYSGRMNQATIALHRHTFIDHADDYVSSTNVAHLIDMTGGIQ